MNRLEFLKLFGIGAVGVITVGVAVKEDDPVEALRKELLRCRNATAVAVPNDWRQSWNVAKGFPRKHKI